MNEPQIKLLMKMKL